ncbi:F510_1955 family glycosylhydrolase [Paenarthrobacter nitroguajacolicus]|uniref:F510_1955 family glycosylhydrolase n=1 Tax=Paenarthrobacter nitroguajacolicus TaxID=211146 RepID=UPI003AE0DEB3
MPFPIPNRSFSAALTAGVLVLALAACTPPNAPSTEAPPTATSGLPSAHIHGLTVSGDSSQVLMATHDGLFDVTKEPATKIGATNDLMGFTTGKGQGVFYASGHPGPGSDLPEPLGLMKSSDGGKTWEPLSRQGESDFHALTTTRSGIVASDTELRTSPDGKTWKTVAAGFAPAALAGHPDSDTVLATTREGVQRSTDGGNTWTLQKQAPVIQFATFPRPAEAVGVEPDGTVHYSSDAGATWARKGRIDGQVQAIAAAKSADGNLSVWAATAEGVLVSNDGGATFRSANPS